MQKLAKLPSLSNVAAGQTATLKMPVGPTYEKLVIPFTGLKLSQITNVTLEINGRDVMFFDSAADLDSLNRYYGRDGANSTPATDTSGNLCFYFRRPELDNLADQRVTGLGTQDVQTLQLKLDLASGTTPGLTAYAVQRGPEALGLITKVKRFNASSSVSGEVEVDNIPRGPRIAAVHFMKDDVSKVQFQADSVLVVDATKGVLQELQKQEGRVTSDNFTSLDFIQEGGINDAYVTGGLQDMRFRLTLDTSGAYPMYVEYLDSFSGI